NALTSDLEIEQKEGEVPNTFVDGRNHLFLSFAAPLPMANATISKFKSPKKSLRNKEFVIIS
ncbi:hypothetical protein GR255_27845, partial [Mycobacterium tuberculosis]|nr:hypothetical protein [Mycobacterium tuberculosis]